MQRSHANGLLLLAALLWGSGNVAQKTILEDIGPFTAVGLRCLIATVVLAPFLLRIKAGTPRVGVKYNLKCIVVVVVSFASAVTLYQIASGLTSVTNTGFLVNTSTVITPILAWALLRQQPGYFVWPAAALTLFGIYLMSGEAFARFNVGDMLALLSAVFYSIWMISLGRYVMRFGEAGSITLVQFFATGLACLVLGVMLEPISFNSLQKILPELLWLGVVSTGIAYFLQAIAQAYTSACEAAVIVSGEAIFGALFAYVLLGESLDSIGLLGAALILCGIATVQLSHVSHTPNLSGGQP